jgi:PAP2 superfamily
MRFERAELFVLWVLLLMAALSIIIAQLKHINVLYSEYIFRGTLALVFLGIGQFCRRVRAYPSIATSATAVALFLVAGQVMRLFNYTLLPYDYSSIDHLLAWLDAKLGFVWSSFAVEMTNYPKLCNLLGLVYISCYLQIASLVIMLGIFRRNSAITRFLSANVIGGLITICIWFLFPSSTPSAFQALSPEIGSKLDLVLSVEWGKWLAAVGHSGLHTLNPSELGGIVGFPSFHTVMAILILRYAKEFPGGLAFYSTLNVLMIPAILLHGAHNLVDVIGGCAVGAISIWLTEKNELIVSRNSLRGELCFSQKNELLTS